MAEIKFSPAHVWARTDGDGIAILGVTDYLQDELGGIVTLDLPDLGDLLQVSRRMGQVESEEATSPLEAPVSGEVLEVNAAILASPDLVNQEPYDGGWLLRVRLDNPSELEDLMSEEEYVDLTTEV
jgi:glycine cleavage system H protein